MARLAQACPLFLTYIEGYYAADSQPIFANGFISSSNLLLRRQVYPPRAGRADDHDATECDILCISIHTEIL